MYCVYNTFITAYVWNRGYSSYVYITMISLLELIMQLYISRLPLLYSYEISHHHGDAMWLITSHLLNV